MPEKSFVPPGSTPYPADPRTPPADDVPQTGAEEAGAPRQRKKTAPGKTPDRAAGRIARAGQTIRAQGWLREPVRRTQQETAGTATGNSRPDPAAFYLLPTFENPALLVELVDDNDRPLLLMPLEQAIRQRGRFRMSMVILRTHDGGIFLRRRPAAPFRHAGRWDGYSAAVTAGEAREDAALRVLAGDPNLADIRPRHLAERAESSDGPRLSLFIGNLPAGLTPRDESGEVLLVDLDELEGLTANSPELFTPELLWATGTFLKEG